MSTELLGLHFNNFKESEDKGLMQHLPALNSAWDLVLNPPPGAGRVIKSRSGNTKVIGRIWVDDNLFHAWYLHGNPVDAGKQAAEMCIAAAWQNPDVDAWVVLNEPPVATLEQVERLVQFEISFMNEMRRANLRACLAAFSVGTPELPEIDGGAIMRAYAPALVHGAIGRVDGKADGKLIDALWIVHQYIPCGPEKLQPHYGHYFQWRIQDGIIPWLKANGYAFPNYVVTECGIDAGAARGFPVDPYRGYFAGWRIERPWGCGDDEQGITAYIMMLEVLMRKYAEDPHLLGVCIYCVGDNGDEKWRSFMVDHILHRLAAVKFAGPGQFAQPLPQPQPQPQPQPGGGGTKVEIVRLRLKYMSQIRPVATTNYAMGDCLQTGITEIANATGKNLTVNRTAELTGLPRGYTSSHIINHGQKTAALPEIGLRFAFGKYLTAEDMRNELRGRHAFLLRTRYKKLQKRYDPNYNQWHFIVVTGFEYDPATGRCTFFYDDPYWESAAEGEDIAISAEALIAAGEDCQALLLRSHTIALVGQPVPEDEPDFVKITWEGEDAERNQLAENRPGNAKWIRDNWVLPARALRDGKAA